MSNRKLSKDRLAFLKAADYIEQHGWCQQVLQDMDGRVCLLGALSFVASGSLCSVRLVGQVGRYLKRTGLTKRGTAVVWNDKPGRTKEEVVAVLRGAAMEGLGE